MVDPLPVTAERQAPPTETDQRLAAAQQQAHEPEQARAAAQHDADSAEAARAGRSADTDADQHVTTTDQNPPPGRGLDRRLHTFFFQEARNVRTCTSSSDFWPKLTEPQPSALHGSRCAKRWAPT